MTSTLNGFTATATVTVTNVQADDYKPMIDPVEIPFGEAPTEEDIKNAISMPDDYPEEWEKPVITVDVSTLPDGKTPGDYEVVVEVAYPDESKDVIKVPVRALRKVVPRDAAIDSQIPKTTSGYTLTRRMTAGYNTTRHSIRILRSRSMFGKVSHGWKLWQTA